MEVRLALKKPFEGVPVWKLGLRILWLAVQLYLLILVGEKGVLFFYQAF